MDQKRFIEEDFNGYLNQLIESHRLEPIQEGITKLVIDKGYDFLSIKQKKVFDYMIDTNTVDSCERCGSDIPFCEMFEALDNGGLCNYCQHMKEKLEYE
ncbi:hypothetical protein [Proteiniphilum sp.]|uniref:hypothetical protein n=1 Tax=Proteiniphilum sp. TaxID=1926877 RepID=UPI002B216DDD|nr:hypothetical protein [Proteiniphilum sp.]MEA4918159.1 hypothetical protein [Proteiniphilum sp.]